MRVLTVIVLGGLLGGCVSSSARRTGDDQVAVPVAVGDASHPASALVFDPPVTRTLPPMDFSRDDRHPSAFAGYQQAITTYIYSRTDDRQSTEFLDSYDRWTVTEQVGTSVR